MALWGNICRVCASPADYEIFDKIPVYLHANSKDFLHWQTPIFELMQDTTGLKICRDDGLPQHICALCISYLKHAFTFREKSIEICMNFIAVKEYKEILNGKKEWNYSKAVNDVIFKQNKNPIISGHNTTTSNSTITEDDNTTNCYYKDQNKVNKRLITSGQNNDNNMARVLTNQAKSCLVYLSQIYDNPEHIEKMGQNGNSILRTRQKKQNLMKSASCEMGTSRGSSGVFSRKRQNYEDEFPRSLSSDEYDEPESNGDDANGGDSGKSNIFSYKEKIFEEDDIMDMEELKDLISCNIESTCKEHKCKFCSRRFMFEESLQEHLKSCVDFKFAELYEEMKNLMYIKRCKEISPHEYIRRMVFSIRKACLWLKENLIDITLPDLLQSKDSGEELEVAQKNNTKSIVSNSENTIQNNDSLTQLRRNPINASNNILHVMAKKSAGEPLRTSQKVNKTVIANSFLQGEKVLPVTAAKTRHTPIPITMGNNILHEIERSENRENNKMTLKKPIPILATSNLNIPKTLPTIMSPAKENPERLAFLEKLQNAAKTSTTPPPTAALSTAHTVNTPIKDQISRNNASTFPVTPLIAVRQDLMETTTTTMTRRAHVSPLMELLQNSSKTQNSSNTSLNACARCPTCNLLFETLDALEIHNAMQHNVLQTLGTGNENAKTKNDLNKDAEHKRIIALFENEDEF